MAEHAETLTIPVELANEFRAAWDAFVAPGPKDLADEEYWKRVVERGQRLLTAYESIWKVSRGSVLVKVGTVRRSALGDVAVRHDIVPGAYAWWSVLHAMRYPHTLVADWPVIGSVPGTPAALSPTRDCTRPSTTGTCLESLASGWITASDLCPGCTRRFMAALDREHPGLVWHPNYVKRADDA